MEANYKNSSRNLEAVGSQFLERLMASSSVSSNARFAAFHVQANFSGSVFPFRTLAVVLKSSR